MTIRAFATVIFLIALGVLIAWSVTETALLQIELLHQFKLNREG